MFTVYVVVKNGVELKRFMFDRDAKEQAEFMAISVGGEVRREVLI